MTPPRKDPTIFALSVTTREPDAHTYDLILTGLFKLMEPGLLAIAEARGVPLLVSKLVDPEERARRIAELKQFVLDNEWDTPLPGSHLTREYFHQ